MKQTVKIVKSFTYFDFDTDLHRSRPTWFSNVIQCSNSMEFKDRPFCHQNEQQLSLVEWQESEQQQQVESHFLMSPPSILLNILYSKIYGRTRSQMQNTNTKKEEGFGIDPAIQN